MGFDFTCVGTNFCTICGLSFSAAYDISHGKCKIVY